MPPVPAQAAGAGGTAAGRLTCFVVLMTLMLLEAQSDTNEEQKPMSADLRHAQVQVPGGEGCQGDRRGWEAGEAGWRGRAGDGRRGQR
jgi:hypothetical protein